MSSVRHDLMGHATARRFISILESFLRCETCPCLNSLYPFVVIYLPIVYLKGIY